MSGAKASRRSVLLAIAAASLTACTNGPASTPAQTVSPSPEPDALLRGEVAAAERNLLASYDATMARHPALAAQLAPFRARHRRHLNAVEASGVVATRQPSATQTPPVPDDPGEALTVLRTAERNAAGARLAQCLRSEDAAVAELLAAAAACEAAHDTLLGAVT
jgi:hypothetical protein